MEAITSDMKKEYLKTQEIALGSAYACLKAVSGEKEMTPTWMSQIHACIQSGGGETACEAIRKIPTAHGDPTTAKKIRGKYSQK